MTIFLFWNILNWSWRVVSSLTTVAWGCRNFKSSSLRLCLNVFMQKWKLLKRLSPFVCLLLKGLNVWCKSGSWGYIDATVSLALFPIGYLPQVYLEIEIKGSAMSSEIDNCFVCFVFRWRKRQTCLWFWSIFNHLILCLQFSIFIIFFRWSKTQVCLAWISSRYLLSAGSPFSLLSSSLSALG